ncbi:hypothetical protein, partial [Escherichia coli]|uniref:hypothetical protein n=1 Tax=Escherichia coli TaxID=562 RepID=UPI001BB476C0
LRQKQKKLIMLPSETMIWQPEFTDKTLSRKTGAVQKHQKLSKFGKIPLMPHTIFLQPMTGRRLKKKLSAFFQNPLCW